MKPAPHARLFVILPFVLASALLSYSQARLVTEAIDKAKRVTLRGNVHPLAQARYDLGSVSASTPAGRLLVLLNRPADQEAALAQYLKDVHTPGSASYHQWLTPQQFGARFGPVDSDIQAVTGWLNAQGFQLARVSPGKILIEFSGTVGQVNQAFHTQIHRYEVNGELHFANATDPQIPEALSGIVRGISPLHDFHARPAIHVVGPAHLDPATRKISPDFTLTGPNGTFYGLGPEDFATQYDLGPLYAAGINGSGKTIGIINDSNIDVSLDNAYRSLFGLASNPAQVVVDGGDPGVNLDELEAYLDVEVAGSVAPAATVNLYVALFDTLDDPLILAAQRAIDDNAADVLSISFGNCEANLGTSHNQILFSLWQQAAAQGQTVFVSTGDNGSAGCDDPAPPRVQAINGFAVNGFASTPWDVAVGGTDFYYSDYASGAPSAATLWNSTNDANNGSLKAPLPEQVWNDWFGFDVTLNYIAPLYSGSGGVSTIYPKPAWQTGSGVPSDGQRDLPDVSLFAADGANLSGYVICVNPGDCTADSTGQIPVTVVGGTSASSPAMAGIMALVNQKHGRQGQANFVLYPLAQQMPTAFHDITLGGNNVPCVQGSPDCVLGTSGTDKGQYTMSGYPATTGYDLASGLGSVDANVLVSNWGKITFLPTITTLQLSPTTFSHGTPVSLTADVTHTSGSDAPSGSVAILTNSPLPFNETEGTLPIGTNGSASGSINSLPGGSYELWASYAGDGIYSGSTSSPISVTVTPEATSVGISAMSMGYTGNPYDYCVPVIGPTETPVANGSTIYPGTLLWLTARPKGTTSGLTAATGSVAFTLDSQPAVTVPLNAKGAATFTTSAADGTAATHSVTASYSGDASYNAAQSSPFTYTASQAKTQFNISPGGICGTGTTCTAYVGDTVPIEVYLRGVGCILPTGTVTVTFGSQSQNVTMSPEGSYADLVLTGIAQFSAATPGTYPITTTYSGDSNYLGASDNFFSISVVAPSGQRIPTTTTVSESSSTLQFQDGATAFTVTVTGGSGSTTAPTGTVYVYDNGSGLASIILTPAGPNSSSGVSYPIQALYPGFDLGLNQITAVYTGDTTYQESVSPPIYLNMVDQAAAPDFSIAPQVPQFVVPKGGSASTSINLASTYNFSGTVNLSCTTSSTAVTCTISPASVNVSGAALATLTVNSTATATLLSARSPVSKRSNLWFLTGASAVLGCFFLAGFSGPKHNRLWLAMTVFAITILWVACGGGQSTTSVPPPHQPPPVVNSYGVVVTATANGTIHSAKVIVVVQ